MATNTNTKLTEQELINIIKESCDLERNPEVPLTSFNFEERVIDRLYDAGVKGFDFDSGASKGVIIFHDFDFVLKFPFQGAFLEDDFDTDLCDYEECLEEGMEDLEEPVAEDYMRCFDRAQNFFLDVATNWDYCALECAVYEEAAIVSLDPYFAKEELFMTVNGYPIYKQLKVCPFYEATSSRKMSVEISEATSKRCSELNVRCLNEVWVSDFFQEYGEDEYVRLCKFFEKLAISDLHDGNIGYYKGFPILIDYSDFNEGKVDL